MKYEILCTGFVYLKYFSAGNLITVINENFVSSSSKRISPKSNVSIRHQFRERMCRRRRMVEKRMPTKGCFDSYE